MYLISLQFYTFFSAELVVIFYRDGLTRSHSFVSEPIELINIGPQNLSSPVTAMHIIARHFLGNGKPKKAYVCGKYVVYGIAP